MRGVRDQHNRVRGGSALTGAAFVSALAACGPVEPARRYVYESPDGSRVYAAGDAAPDVSRDATPDTSRDSSPDAADWIEVEPRSVSLEVGQALPLRVLRGTYEPGDLSEVDVSAECGWSVAENNIARITGASSVLGVAAGQTVLRATYRGLLSSPVFVTVNPPPASVVQLQVSPMSTRLRLDPPERRYFSVSGFDAFGNSVRNVNGSVTWAVRDPSIVALAPDGAFEPRAAGTTTITASIGAVTSRPVEVFVVASGLQGVSVTAAVSVVRVGSTLPLQVTATYDDGAVDVSHLATVHSSDESIGFVNAGGLYGRAPGAVRVTASYGSATSFIDVTVLSRE